MLMNLLNTSVGLALGGGAAKGIAHIGVLQALEDAEVKIDYLAGTSVGSMIAALYAFGVDLEIIGEVAQQLTLSKVSSFKLTKTGFFSTDSIKALIIDHLGTVNIEDANIPLAIIATDINTGEQVVFRSGPLAEAVCASSAIPGVYIPMEINGRMLVDGGLVQNVPVGPLKSMGAGVTIASHLSNVDRYPQPTHILDVMRNAFEIAVSRHTQTQLKEADLVIGMNLSDFSLRDNTDRYDELFAIGYNSGKQQITKLAWYHKTNLLMYVWRLIQQLAPFKVPELIKTLGTEKDVT
ncbi:MAG: patatin-like phospholipase family protein [Porticoccaceae bacterium]|nr:patatin-like phospholipase family protein [Porticoccaceae bacterium]